MLQYRRGGSYIDTVAHKRRDILLPDVTPYGNRERIETGGSVRYERTTNSSDSNSLSAMNLVTRVRSRRDNLSELEANAVNGIDISIGQAIVSS